MIRYLNNLSEKRRATFAGILILTAYLLLVTDATDSRIIGFLADALSGLSVIGIAVLLYPLFVGESKTISLGYLVARSFEGLLMILSGIFVLLDNYESRNFIYDNIHIYTFIAGSGFLYWLLYKTLIVPRFISVWGFVAVFFLFLNTILGLFEISSGLLDSTLALIVTNEIFLAVWLMTKGLALNTQPRLSNNS